jgi:hypothetical protein
VGIHEPGVDIPELFQCKKIGSVLRALENVGGRLVNGHRSGTSRGVGRLARMQGEGAQLIARGGHGLGGKELYIDIIERWMIQKIETLVTLQTRDPSHRHRPAE